MTPLLVALALGAQPVALLRPAEDVRLNERTVTLGDLAEVKGTASARALEGRVVTRLPSARRSVALSRDAVAALIRRAVPGLAVRGGPGRLVIHQAPRRAAARPDNCFALAGPLAAGAILRPADLAAAPCAGKTAETSLHFDRRAGSVRAATALPAGAFVGRLVLPAAAEVEAGQALTVVSTVGPVRIERPVVALQPGRNGGRAFVRDGEGQVFAAPVSVVSEAQ